MGWVNYIVVDAWETKIVVSRNIQLDNLDVIKKQLDDIQVVYENLPEDAFEEQQKNITTKGYMDYLRLAHDAYLLSVYGDTYFLDYMLLLWLMDRKIDYRVVSEYEIKDDRGKDYRTVEYG